jgi:molybdopterin-guanine dinucleotide biosynthesis protein A
MKVDGLILAAGRSNRMGASNKVHAVLNGKPLLHHVIERLAPQVQTLAVNGDPAALGDQQYPIIEDALAGFQGPLTGLYSALVSRSLSDAKYLMMVPCDGPFVPANLVAELSRQIAVADSDCACIHYKGFSQPTFSLWHKRVTPAVEQALLVRKQGGFKPLFEGLHTLYIDWPEQVIDPFFNVNTPEDLAVAETILCP